MAFVLQFVFVQLRPPPQDAAQGFSNPARLPVQSAGVVAIDGEILEMRWGEPPVLEGGNPASYLVRRRQPSPTPIFDDPSLASQSARKAKTLMRAQVSAPVMQLTQDPKRRVSVKGDAACAVDGTFLQARRMSLFDENVGEQSL